MSSDSQGKKSPPTGLWVLVLKTGELRAELGYLCLCCENGGPDVAVWQGIGDLTDKTHAHRPCAPMAAKFLIGA